MQENSNVPLAYTDQTLDIQPTKVHIRGLDEVTTNDVREFSKEHFQLADPKKVEWIDDTSANIIYGTSEFASKALEALTLNSSNPALIGNPLELRVAKSMPSRPGSMLQIRMALFSDKKERGAYDKSRFYLMHPEHDPRERTKMEREKRGDNCDYKRRRYDDREHRRRRDREDDSANFDASMYDDDGGERPSKRRARSASPGGYSDSDRSRFRSRHSPPPRRRDNNAKKELFPMKSGANGSSDGTSLLARERDAPPKREVFPAQVAVNKSIAKNLKRELFPNKTEKSNHRRTDAFDAKAKEASDRYDKITSPLSDSSRELFPNSVNDTSGMNIRGSAGISIKGGAGISIKGRGSKEIKELFPESYNETRKKNEGKELFNDILEGRGGRRRRAEDMFG